MSTPSSAEAAITRYRLIIRKEGLKLAGKLAEEVDYRPSKMAVHERPTKPISRRGDDADLADNVAGGKWGNDGKDDRRQAPGDRNVRKHERTREKRAGNGDVFEITFSAHFQHVFLPW